MIEETFSDEERRLLFDLAVCSIPLSGPPDAVVLSVIAKLAGCDTVLVAKRAYASHKPAPRGGL